MAPSRIMPHRWVKLHQGLSWELCVIFVSRWIYFSYLGSRRISIIHSFSRLCGLIFHSHASQGCKMIFLYSEVVQREPKLSYSGTGTCTKAQRAHSCTSCDILLSYHHTRFQIQWEWFPLGVTCKAASSFPFTSDIELVSSRTLTLQKCIHSNTLLCNLGFYF